MTQQDNWRPEVARLTQRQDQLERAAEKYRHEGP